MITASVVLTSHAVKRWIERVDDTLTPPQAASAVRDFLSHATLRNKPRRWMPRHAQLHGVGTRYAYCWRYPRVCIVVDDGTAITVLTKELCSGDPW